MADSPNIELVGATDQPVPVRGYGASSTVRLDRRARRKVADSLSPPSMDDLERGDAVAAPDRVFLNLENVRGSSDATAFHVYVGLDDAPDADAQPGQLAGSIAPFGLSAASDPDDEHGGQGLTFVLEITEIVDRLHLQDALDVDDLSVRIVPVRPVGDGQELEIGRISVFRQGA